MAERPFGLLVLVLLVCANGSLQLGLGIFSGIPILIILAITSFIVCYGLILGDRWSWIAALALDILYLAISLLALTFLIMDQYGPWILGGIPRSLFLIGLGVFIALYPVLVILLPARIIFSNMPVVLMHVIPALFCFIPIVIMWYLMKSHIKDFFLANKK